MQLIECRAKSFPSKQLAAIWNRRFRNGLRFETAHGCWDYKSPLFDKIGDETLSLLDKKSRANQSWQDDQGQKGRGYAIVGSGSFYKRRADMIRTLVLPT